MRKHWTVSLYVVVSLILPFAAFGQTVKGENVVVLKEPVTTALAGGITYVTAGTRQFAVIEDPKHPLNGASGDCDGACVIGADKKSVCMGSCTWVDRGGDVAFFTWDGQDEGGWKLLGGSGKWKDASGAGTWKNGPVSAGAFGRNIWQGSMQMTKK